MNFHDLFFFTQGIYQVENDPNLSWVNFSRFKFFGLMWECDLAITPEEGWCWKYKHDGEWIPFTDVNNQRILSHRYENWLRDQVTNET